MNKHYLMSRMKSTGTAYLCWFFLGVHYAYLGKWGLQFLYWFTLGGFGIWILIDLFHIPTKVSNHNMQISMQIDRIEKNELEQAHARNMALVNASAQKTPA
ncbi:TM2 domain-containing protein [Roseivirga sp. BDSF3-8]|uniref:TM2 domain-containing protein n=1 Tax=Roseivirga sp. BDSF3-8 TaxID=3241598 RepID=UPI0035326A7A